MEATEEDTGRGEEDTDQTEGSADAEAFRPPETMQEAKSSHTKPPDTRPPDTRPPDEVPSYMSEQALAYLAYILREAELIRARTEMIRRNTTLIIVLLAIAVIVLIIVWLDITGAIRFI